MLITEGGPKGGRPVMEERRRDNYQGAGLDGAVRHVPGLNPGLKIPTPPVGGVQAVPPFRGRICLAQCAGAKGGPKGGRPVVEERVNVNHQGAALPRVAGVCQNTTPFFSSIHYDSLCALRRRA